MGCFHSMMSLFPMRRNDQDIQHRRDSNAVTSSLDAHIVASISPLSSAEGAFVDAPRPVNMSPLKPLSICEVCWQGPFAAHFGLLNAPLDFASTDSTGAGYLYSTSWAELEFRADAGCRWCRLVLNIRGDADGSNPTAPLTIAVGEVGSRRLRRHCTPEDTQSMSVYINGQHGFSGYVYANPDDPAAPYIVARSPVLDVGSQRTLSLAKASIDRCVHEHHRCGAFSMSTNIPLPTRLIDCADPSHPRLAPTGDMRGTYLALSYVWGEAQPHSTTKQNISTYTKRIDAAWLPQTILDAIHVTHELGFQYLWVDSLCIVQNDDEDKQREIGRMRRIYRDAYLTIIASSARRVGEGFLQDRPPSSSGKDNDFSRDFALPFICPRDCAAEPTSPPSVGTIYISPVGTSADPFGYTLLPYNPAQEPISVRGWCMQEYFMSTRSLLFTSQTIQFRCQTTTMSIGNAYHDTYYDRRLPDILFLADPPLVEQNSKVWEIVRTGWQTSIQDYTRRNITLASDKLVACGGIAEEFASVFRSEYLAGLWRVTLLEDLLWRHASFNTTLSRPTEYRAPSWSWAAIEGEVYPGTPDYYKGMALAEVVKCEVTLKDAVLPFGEVTGASLVLRAPLIPCSWYREKWFYCFSLQSQVSTSLHDVGSGLDDQHEVEAVTSQIVLLGTIDVEDDAAMQTGWVVPIRGREDTMEGLVLTRAGSADAVLPERKRNAFRRVGRFNTDPNHRLRISSWDWVSEQSAVEIEIV